MNAIDAKLRQMRAWFIVWFVVESAAGLAIAVQVVEGLRRQTIMGVSMAGATTEVTLVSGIAVLAALLGLAGLVFQGLLRFQPWARTVLLVVGWLTAVGAAFSLLSMPVPGSLQELGLGMTADEWGQVRAATIVTESLDLLFWSWVIYTLQFTPAVRDAFACAVPRDASGTA